MTEWLCSGHDKPSNHSESFPDDRLTAPGAMTMGHLPTVITASVWVAQVGIGPGRDQERSGD